MAGNRILPQETAEFNRHYVGLLLEDRLFVLWDRVHANGGEQLRQTSCVFDLARGPQHLVELLAYIYENPEELPGRAMENDDAVEKPALDVLVQFDEGILERPCMLRQQSRERSVSPGTRGGGEPQRDDAAGPAAGDDCSHGDENEVGDSARPHEQSVIDRSRETRDGSEPQRNDAVGPAAGDDCSHGEENALGDSARPHGLQHSITDRSWEAREEYVESMIFWSCHELPSIEPLMAFTGESGLISLCDG
ncbi:hypothetical protein Tdes44962_MAKER05341 [Teratosphaeria destructans]|uniref:Uncharacterized protein n=1 Tax=Teratosphaeria destructans TaxID=418781 RepID=A0A9W7SK74_9PEZI|nr:hypothetical protein Tdes44962_MAKER05341 [Teratosphaeria destructans]